MILLALALAASQTSPCGNLESQIEMNECAAKEFRAADAAMNAQWKRTLAHMRVLDTGEQDPRATGPGYAQALLDAQRAWLAFRDAHCRTVGYYARGGSLEGMMYSECQAELTRDRTAQLADLVDRDAM